MSTKDERKELGIKMVGDTMVLRSCWICSKAGLKKCSGCDVRRYCSPDCQKKDWSRHKQECKDFQKYGVEIVKFTYLEYIDQLEKDPEFRASEFRHETPENAEVMLKRMLSWRENPPPGIDGFHHGCTRPAKPPTAQ